MAMSVVYASVNGRLVQENRGGAVTRYVADTLGSVIQTRDASGNQSSSTTYWPFGEVRTQTGTNPSPWGFCGIWGYFTDAANRLYVRARNLRADLSRWMTVDLWWPMLRAYEYVLGRPISLVDPNGLSPCQQPKCDCKKACDDWMKATGICGKDYPPPAPPGTKIGGFALCCNTEPCSCMCPGHPAEKNPILKKCFDAHELGHITPGACTPGYTGYPKNPPNTGTECAAQMAEIRCLWGECEGKNLISNDCMGASERRCWLCKNMLKDVCGKNLPSGFYEKYCAKCAGVGK